MADEIQIERGPGAELQDALRKLLKDDAYFADIVVITERMKEITYEIDYVLSTLTQEGGKLGIAVIIFLPDLKVTSPNLPGPVFGELPIIARVVEDPVINQADGGTKKCGHDVAIAVARIWHHKFDPKLFAPILVSGIFSATDDRVPGAVVKDVKATTKLKK